MRKPDPEHPQDLLFPLLGFGSGRSGSTLLMQLLASDARCVLPATHSYEERYLSHMLQFAYLFDGIDLAGVSSSQAITSALGLFPRLQAGHQADFTGNLNPEDIFIDLWRRFSTNVKEQYPDAMFYAEKLPLSSMLPRVNCPHHTIFHFRDPRDIYLSANAFMKKKQVVGFGRQYCENDLQFALSISAGIAEEFANYQALRGDSDCTMVQYETLVIDPQKALTAVEERTGLQLNPDLPKELYKDHRTTASPHDSIYRWKRETIPSDIRACFDTNIAEELTGLGYETHEPWRTEILSIDFTDSRDVDHCTSNVQGGQAICTDKGLELSMNEKCLTLTFKVNISADAVPEIWLCTAGQNVDYFRLSWSSDGARPSEQQSVTITSPFATHHRLNRFVLGNHPLWRGNIRVIQLSLLTAHLKNVDCKQILRWLRFVEIPTSLDSKVFAPNFSPNMQADQLIELVKEQKAEIASLTQQLQNAQVGAIKQSAHVQYMGTELDKTVDVVKRLQGHAAHLQRERDFFQSRWTKLTDFQPVRNLLELRAYFRSQRPRGDDENDAE